MSFGDGLCFPYWPHVPQILMDIVLLAWQERQRVRASGIHIEALLCGDLGAAFAIRTVQMPRRGIPASHWNLRGHDFGIATKTWMTVSSGNRKVVIVIAEHTFNDA